MAITQEFKNAVEQRDILMIKIMLKDILMIDPTFVEFNEMISFANNKGLNLYDTHNGEEFKEENEWTEEYMDKEMIELLDNFSQDRVELIKKMCIKFYSERRKTIEYERRSSDKKNKFEKKTVGAGLIVAGAATNVVSAIAIKPAVAIGAIAIKPLIIATGVSMMVIGGAMIVMGGE